MASPAAWVAQLDRFLVVNGEDIVLRKMVGTTNRANIDVKLRAKVKPLPPVPASAGSAAVQERFQVILSPTEIDRAQWPGGVEPSFTGDPRHPVPGYKAVIRDKERQIEAAAPLIRGGALVRIEFTAAG